MAKEKEPIPLGEHRPSAKPAHKHDEADHDGDKQKPVCGFPNEIVADGHNVGCLLFSLSPKHHYQEHPLEPGVLPSEDRARWQESAACSLLRGSDSRRWSLPADFGSAGGLPAALHDLFFGCV